MSKPVPAHCLVTAGVTTQRDYRRAKRAELRGLRAAYNKFRIGCLYLPVSGAGVFETWLQDWERDLSPKEWGS
jgi:hypothetical protein